MKIHQRAVHSNGYRINYSHANTSHSNNGSSSHTDTGGTSYANSGYNNHSNSAYGNHSNSGSYTNWTMADPAGSCWNWHGDGYHHTNSGGYSNHSNGYNNHTNASYSNHTDTGYSNHSNNGVTHSNITETSRVPSSSYDLSATVSGQEPSASGYYNSKTIYIDLNNITFSSDATKYRIYYQFCTTKTGTYSGHTLLSEQTGKTYTWVATSRPAGWYKIGITAYDGQTWSAQPSGSSWTYDHKQTYPSNSVVASGNGTGYTNVIQDTTAYDSVQVAVSVPIRIYHYTAPTFNTDYYTKENIDQTQTEINKVLSAMGQNNIVFTNAPVVKNFTIITWTDMKQLRDAATDAYTLRKDVAPTLSAQTDIILNDKIIDIQNILSILSQGGK